jgi:hypothetical protein
LDWGDRSVVAFYAYLSILAGVLHITSPGAVDGHIPQCNWTTVGIAVSFRVPAGGGGIAGRRKLALRVLGGPCSSAARRRGFMTAAGHRFLVSPPETT